MTAAPAVPVRAIVALSLAAGVSGVSLRVTDALLPRLAHDFGIALGQAAQVVTAFAVAYGLAQLLFGPLGDRFGKFRIIGWACAASSLTSLACALASGPGTLVVARFVAGATAAAVIPLSMAWIGDVVPYDQRQPVLARFLIGQISGMALGVWLGGFAAEHLDWRTPFFVLAGAFGALALLLAVVQRRVPAASARGSSPARQGLRREFGAVFALPWARVVLSSVFLEGAVMFGAFPFIAAHLHRQFGLPLSTAGALLMGFALGGLGFALGARWFVPRWGEVRLVHGGAWVVAVALGVVAFAPAWGWTLPAFVAMGLGFYMLHNTLQTQATQMAPERRGAAVAAFAGCFFLGQSVGAALGGALVDVVGTRMLLAAGGLGVLAVGWQFNRRRQRVLPAVAATG
jgi:predicted MFS family arabinose efflux permease